LHLLVYLLEYMKMHGPGNIKNGNMIIYSHQSPSNPKSLNRSIGQGIPRNYGIWMSTEMRNPANRPYLNHSIQIYAQFIEHPFNNALPYAPSSTVYSSQVSQSKSCMHFSLSTYLIPVAFIAVHLCIWRRHQIIRSFLTQVFSILLILPLYYAQFIRECNFNVPLLFSNTWTFKPLPFIITVC
jgi:hypothetical protein